MKDKAPQSTKAILRQKAEEILKNKPPIVDTPSVDSETLKLIHELDVHQIELEMLNEELKIAKEQLETATEKYIDLYDFAPSGYFSLSKNGKILELNFRGANMLGKERSLLINSLFAIFIADDAKLIFSSFLDKLYESKVSETCEIILFVNANTPTYLLLNGIATEDDEQCFITAIDITKRKTAEKYLQQNEEKYRTLFDTNRDSITIFRFTPDGKPGNFIEANAATTELFGYTKQELMSMTIRDVESISQKIRKKRIETLQSDGKVDFESFLKTKKGKIRNVEIEALIINYMNEPAVMSIARDITERKQIENNAKKAQESLATILEAIPDLLFEIGFDGRIYHYQSHRDDLLAMPANEFMGKLFQEVLPVDVSAVISTAIQEASKKGWSNGHQYSLDLAKGKYWFELSVSPIKENGDKEKHFIVLARDITERKLAEESLAIQKLKLETVLRGTNTATWEWNIKTGEAVFNERWAEIIGYTLEEISPVSIDTWIKFVHPDDLIKSNQLLEKCFKDKSKFYECEARMKHKNGTWVWILDRGKVNKLDIDGKPLLMSGTHQDITKRKHAEIALREHKEKLQGIFNVANSGIVMLDTSGNFLLFNNWCHEMLGYTKEEFRKLNSTVVTHPDDREQSKLLNNKLIEGKIDRYQVEKRYLRKDKSFFWCEVSISTVKDENKKVVNLIAVINDITELKQTEKIQKDSLDLIEKITSRVPGVVYQFKLRPDGTFCFPYASEGMKQIFDINPVEVIENASIVFAGIHPDDIDDIYASIEESAKNLTPWKQECRFIHSNGEIRFLLGNSIPQREEDGSVIWYGFITDITEKKIIENYLRESEDKIRNLLDSTDGIIWEADAQTFNFTFVSKQAERLFGFPVEEWYGEGFWKNHIYPEDKNQTVQYCIDHTKRMESHDFTYRFMTNNGQVVWLRDIVKVIVADGKPSLLRGVMFDITKQKQVEESLRESEMKYRGLVENSPDAIVIYSEGKIVFVNDEGISMIGAKNKGELIGKPVLQFIHPDSLASVIQRMEEVVRDASASDTVEEKFVDLNGNPIDVEIKAIPTVYQHKEAVQVIIHDITKRKQASLELNKINRVYSLISQINNLIIRSKDKAELLKEICRIAVTAGKFRMSWIGMIDEDKKTINTAAFYGYEDGYFTKYRGISILDEARGKGPTGTAMREARTIICNDIANDSIMKPWREGAIQRGYRSSISIPIMVLDSIIGSFNLYSEETNAFTSEEEVALLEKITQNIAFTLESILFEEDRQRTQEKIQQLSQAVEQSPVAIIITDTKGNIEYVNPKFSETSGYTFNEIVGQNPRILKSGHTSNDEYQELWQTLTAGNEWHGEFHNIGKNGELYWESASISPIINTQGKTTHYIAIKEDITDRKKVEKQLIKAKEKAEESDRLKLAFLANMSHEIRTPMNGILGFTELLKSPNLDGEEQQEYIRIIEKSGIRMLNIINDIISISKVEAGQVEISLSETNVNEQIEYLHTFFKPEAAHKGILLSINNELPTEKAIIITDREKVYAILTNLVKNAIKFTDAGSINFGYAKKGNYLEFFVKDTGFGISDAHKKIVFDRFRQANESLTRSHEGSGLGLAISKAYVEMLGGKIWMESKEGKGSSFYFTIPYDTKSEEKEKIISEKTAINEKTENKIKDLKILIVEDDAISKLLITIAVKPFSKEILKVSTGSEAIEACRTNSDIDLVMMDINMPEMGGYEATKQIREFNKDLVIIAQTANGMQSDRDEAIAAGCTDYISKPVNIASLSALINKYFKK